MMTWISANISSILVSAILLTIVISIIIYLVRKKKNGSSCSGNCGTCMMCGSTYSKNKK